MCRSFYHRISLTPGHQRLEPLFRRFPLVSSKDLPNTDGPVGVYKAQRNELSLEQDPVVGIDLQRLYKIPSKVLLNLIDIQGRNE